jgi:glycolate oxidase iron-sulfur subunit
LDNANACIHCGLCLPACPTFEKTRRERSGPRGRIALMLEADYTATVRGELDFCLGCLACTSACPAGVDFGAMLEHARTKTTPRWRRAILRTLFGGPRRLKLLRPWPGAKIAELEGPDEKPVARVGLLTGCVQNAWFRDVNRDTADILLQHGCEVVTPDLQGCCGALHAHQGDPDFGHELARRIAKSFEQSSPDLLISNSAGCGAHLKNAGLPVRDIHEFLHELGIREAAPFPRPIPVTYHDACHLAHGQAIRREPRALLRAVPNLELKEMAESDWCCGSAGVYNLTQPEFALELRERKSRHARETGAEILAAANPGCLLQLRGTLRPMHPVSIWVRAATLG